MLRVLAVSQQGGEGCSSSHADVVLQFWSLIEAVIFSVAANNSTFSIPQCSFYVFILSAKTLQKASILEADYKMERITEDEMSGMQCVCMHSVTNWLDMCENKADDIAGPSSGLGGRASKQCISPSYVFFWRYPWLKAFFVAFSISLAY